LAMVTVWAGCSRLREGSSMLSVLVSASVEPMMKEPAGITTISGQSGQSRKVVPGFCAEADDAKCLISTNETQDLRGQMFRYERIEAKGSQVLLTAPNGDALVTANKVGRGRVIFVALPDLLGEDERLTPFAAHLFAHLLANASPIRVEGRVEYLINRNSNGWVVTLFNDEGVFKPQQGLAQVDRSASLNVKISLPGQNISSATEWLSDARLTVQNRSEVRVTIPPGGIAIVELK